jgi:hypothetical protein
MAKRRFQGTLLVAVPTTREEFARDVARRSDFLLQKVRFTGDEDAAWSRYGSYEAICNAVIEDVEQCGIRVIRGAALADLMQSVAQPGTTTLVAHAAGRSVEFADGLWDYAEIDAALPVQLAGTLDLTVCLARGLAALLRRRRPSGAILANRDTEELELKNRLALYRQTVIFAADRGVSYAEAAVILGRPVERDATAEVRGRHPR